MPKPGHFSTYYLLADFLSSKLLQQSFQPLLQLTVELNESPGSKIDQKSNGRQVVRVERDLGIDHSRLIQGHIQIDELLLEELISMRPVFLVLF